MSKNINEESQKNEKLPQPEIKQERRWLPSLVWLIPLIAALIGILLIVNTYAQRGPLIKISFKNAEGLEAGKTRIKYKEVDIGTVNTISLNQDHSMVIVEARLTNNAKDFAVAGSKFWIVKPRVAAGGVTGLGTLLSGSYIGVDPGHTEKAVKNFVGLDLPPAVTCDEKGNQYTLHAETLNSIDIGSPVYYKRIQVGRVVDYQLDSAGRGMMVKVFVRDPFNQYVGSNTRFWNVSGIDVSLDANGLKLNTQSLTAILLGGIAFETPPLEELGELAAKNAEFNLADDEKTAMRAPDGEPTYINMTFNQSLRGLHVGAPVDFRGITLGDVIDIGVEFNRETRSFTMPVRIKIYGNRLGESFISAAKEKNSTETKEIIRKMIASGLRGQLRTGNLLTGQLYIALDFFPKAPKKTVSLTSNHLEIPTVPNTLDQLQLQVASIASKIEKIPFDKISDNLNQTLKQSSNLFTQLNNQVAPEAQATLAAARRSFINAERLLAEDSTTQVELRRAIRELATTAETLNQLADYLQRHPEALIRGKKQIEQTSK